MKFNIFLALIFALQLQFAIAQSKRKLPQEQCGTVIRLSNKMQENPGFKAMFEQKRAAFNSAFKKNLKQSQSAREDNDRTVYVIPVVFHIVLQYPANVKDASIQAALDSLNKYFAGNNADSTKIPSYFKPLFGKSNIQFCLAQRTPDGEATDGIERITTTATSFTSNDDVKRSATGGVAPWNPDKYYNVWVCLLAGNLLGYATFPEDTDRTVQGVVIDYRTLPGGLYNNYNTGKTLVHETGHYFDLYHIWGDDNGSCTGTDYVDDTPNQADYSSGCFSGIKTDLCTSGGNGIMYQNYMDYSNDNCLVMFTKEQVARMESALLTYRSSLLTSDGCTPAIRGSYDVKLVSIDNPVQRLCSPTFSPVITVKNNGEQTLTSINVVVKKEDGSQLENYKWEGSLATAASTNITLDNLTTTSGNHTLTIYTTQPNGNADERTANDTLSVVYSYFEPVNVIAESFEKNQFPPEGWDVINPDGNVTWQRITGVAKTGNASVWMNNFNYTVVGQKDYLRLPQVTIGAVDSAYFSFQVAAAAYTYTGTVNNSWDTLEVLVSRDCGKTYTSVYKKWGSTLVTRLSTATTSFEPTADEWRKDSINLVDYINNSNLLFAFRSTNEYENNIYIDDVNLRSVTINPNLKRQGFLVTPNPVATNLAIQFYPQPSDLVALQLFDVTGKKLKDIYTRGQANNYYNFNMANYAAGMYIVKAIFLNRVLTKKIIKQ